MSDMQSLCHVYGMQQSIKVSAKWAQSYWKEFEKNLNFIKIILRIIVTVLLQIPREHMHNDKNLEGVGEVGAVLGWQNCGWMFSMF